MVIWNLLKIFICLGYKIDNVIFEEKNRILNFAINGDVNYGRLAEIYPDKI